MRAAPRTQSRKAGRITPLVRRLNRKRNPVPFASVPPVAKTPRPLPSRPARSLAAGLLLAAAGFLFAADPVTPRLGAGATFETLQAGKSTYQKVQVRSVNARSLMISHAGGIASVRLRDLSPELQAAFGYDANSEAAAESALKNAQARAEQTRAKETQARAEADAKKPTAAATQIDNLVKKFGVAPELRPSVDLRTKYLDLGLTVKNQGARPSCAVFAIVSALEFQNAELTGQPQRFSEEYLSWATCKTLNRAPRISVEAAAAADIDNVDAREIDDEGFALSEVVTALRAYGIPLQSRLPYTFGRTNAVADPPPEVIEEARSHRRVSVFGLPGRDQTARLANLLHALNEGVPVPVGLAWPSARSVRTGYLNTQRPLPNGGHAVTIVGYENKTGVLTDTVFTFKNSWGVRWGVGGFGYATYTYLFNNLQDAAVLEVEPALATTPRAAK